jgi:hypothetical protein
MSDEAVSDSGYQVQRQQLQKQRQQQQLQQEQRPFFAPGTALPEKQHQSKHNPVSEAPHHGSRGGHSRDTLSARFSFTFR